MRLPLFGRRAEPEAGPTFTWLSPAEAKELLHTEHVPLIDVREDWEYRAGHIPGARLLPLRTLLRQAQQQISGDSVMFVCAVGERAKVACEMAVSLGLTRVFNIRGGMNAWMAAGYPVER